jgi:hypothetical protein
MRLRERLYRLFIERPSDRVDKATAARRVIADNAVHPCLNDEAQAARAAAERKQEELAQRVTNLVNHMQATSGKVDLLWHEHERRCKQDPDFVGPEKRHIDAGPPLVPRHEYKH